MANVAHMLTQEPIYKPSSIFCFKPILLSAHKLSLLIYGDNTSINIFGYALGCALCLHSKNYTIYLKSKKI